MLSDLLQQACEGGQVHMAAAVRFSAEYDDYLREQKLPPFPIKFKVIHWSETEWIVRVLVGVQISERVGKAC